MLNRQSGAAHVNIFFFLVILVLFLGAVGFGYVQTEEAARVQRQLDEVRAELQAAKDPDILDRHILADLGEVLGETGEYAGRKGVDYSGFNNPAPLTDVPVPAKLEEALKNYAKTFGVAETKGLAALMGKIETVHAAKQTEIDNLGQTVTQLRTQVASLTQSAQQAAANHQATVDSLSTQLNQATANFTATLAQKDNQISSQNDEINTLRGNITDEREARANDVAAVRKEMQGISDQLLAFQTKFPSFAPRDDADGKIVNASDSADLAWIDIGQNQMLATGTRFQVRSPIDGNLKGVIEVTELGDNDAKARIVSVADAMNPIVPGDEIVNDVFSPGFTRTIYLLGRFSTPYAQEDVKLLLERLGNTVVDRLSPGVDLVVLGADPLNEDSSGFVALEDTEDFKKADSWSIPMASLASMRDFLSIK